MNTTRPLTIWTNAGLEPAARAKLEEGVAAGGHRLVVSKNVNASVLAAGGADPLLDETDVAFGQPHAEACRDLARLKWIALTTAFGSSSSICHVTGSTDQPLATSLIVLTASL